MIEKRRFVEKKVKEGGGEGGEGVVEGFADTKVGEGEWERGREGEIVRVAQVEEGEGGRERREVAVEFVAQDEGRKGGREGEEGEVEGVREGEEREGGREFVNGAVESGNERGGIVKGEKR